MDLENKVRQQLLSRGFTKEQLLNNRGLIGAVIDETALNVVKNLAIHDVSGMLPLTENAKSKLEYINGSCIARDFPKEQPTKQWAGAVLDLLEELGFYNYELENFEVIGNVYDNPELLSHE